MGGVNFVSECYPFFPLQGDFLEYKVIFLEYKNYGTSLSYTIFVFQEPTLQGGLNRAPGAPLVKTAPAVLTSVQKLLHLAEVEGLRVQFTDYPKVSLTILALNLSSIIILKLY